MDAETVDLAIGAGIVAIAHRRALGCGGLNQRDGPNSGGWLWDHARRADDAKITPINKNSELPRPMSSWFGANGGESDNST
ncbi:hypothetical protein Rcae01_02985 [Novipirellula caenicola]|uniref:Uncharacterized protein n=1 Tax=Novipirellula caenicola TaxID=1536901 RepID=A0ABP9VQU1_9BACT